MAVVSFRAGRCLARWVLDQQCSRRPLALGSPSDQRLHLWPRILIVSLQLLWVVGWLLRIAANGPHLEFMLPHRAVELAWWIALSVTAGICEETVFRGYLQRQFPALTKSFPAAILISATTFGVAFAYQGLRMVILITVFGAMFGLLAHWRGTVRPGMIAHVGQDSLNGILASVANH